MPVTEKSELIFITAMMILIMILSITAVYIFFRTYKKEMRDKELRKQAKELAAENGPEAETETRPVGSVSDIDDPEAEI